AQQPALPTGAYRLLDHTRDVSRDPRHARAQPQRLAAALDHDRLAQRTQQLRAHAIFGGRAAQPADVDAPDRHPLRDDLAMARVVGIDAAREPGQDRKAQHDDDQRPLGQPDARGVNDDPETTGPDRTAL